MFGGHVIIENTMVLIKIELNFPDCVDIQIYYTVRTYERCIHHLNPESNVPKHAVDISKLRQRT